MAGFQSKKITCMANKRRTNIRCNAKGYLVNTFNKDGTARYLCRNHGAQSSDFYGVRSREGRGGFKKPGYDDEDRIRLLSNLKQFKNKPIEYVRNYYNTTIKERIDNNRFKSEYSRRAANRRLYTYRDFYGAKSLTNQLTQILLLLTKARKQRDQSQD
jgi:hypothetical protein